MNALRRLELTEWVALGRWRIARALAVVMTVLPIAGCGGGAPAPAIDRPSTRLPDGWAQAGEERIFDRETIYELVDGQADAYFAYSFEQVTVRTFERDNGEIIETEVWRVAAPSDAYGLFSSNRAGQPVQLGNGGDADPGRRVAFWQDRYYIRVRARQNVRDDTLHALATIVSTELPDGGERPALVGRLPTGGLVADSDIFFHLEISIQDQLWLGGDNILGLDLATDGLLARYRLDGTVAHLLMVEYDDRQAASAALRALRTAPLESLVAADAEGATIAAAFGDLPENDGVALIGEALLDG